MTDVAEYNFLRKLTEEFITNINKQLFSEGQSFNIKDTNKDNVFTLGLYTKKTGNNKPVYLQEFRYSIRKDMPAFKQYVLIYKEMYLYLLSTAMIVIDQAAIQMRMDEDMQDKARGVFIHQEEPEVKPKIESKIIK